MLLHCQFSALMRMAKSHTTSLQVSVASKESERLAKEAKQRADEERLERLQKERDRKEMEKRLKEKEEREKREKAAREEMARRLREKKKEEAEAEARDQKVGYPWLCYAARDPIPADG